MHMPLDKADLSRLVRLSEQTGLMEAYIPR
jgi:hypothetical protein